MIGLGMNGDGPEAVHMRLNGGVVDGGSDDEFFCNAHRKVQLKDKEKKSFE